MKQIEWKNKALRELRKIKSTQDRDDIYEAVGKLVLFPDCDNIKYIVNSDRPLPFTGEKLESDLL